MEDTDLAYFAGIFDGEGTVTLAKTQISSPKQRLTYQVRVQVVSTDEWLCQALRFSFGGSVMPHRVTEGNHKPAYRWLATRVVAKRFMLAIYPYTKLKRQRIELALKFLSHKTAGGYKTQEYIDIEQDFKTLMSTMNKRGKV